MSIRTDAHYALRSLRRRPGLVTLVTLTLGVGIAANTIMFGIVHELLLQPPARVAKPETLRRVFYDAHREGWKPTGTTTFPIVGALMRNVPGAEIAAMTSAEKYTLGGGPAAREIAVQLVSGNYFGMLGVGPALGRVVQPSDDRIPVGEQVVVLSDGFWRAQFGADPAIAGRVLTINARPFVVIGVAPAGFMGVDRTQVDAWIPLSADATQQAGAHWHDRADTWWVQAIARLRPGASADDVTAHGTRAIQAEFRRLGQRDTLSTVVLGSIIGALHPGGVSAEGKVSLWLFGVSLVVLLIACANVANLLLARTVQRRREIAVHLALGMGRAGLARLLFVETALLATAGAIAATLLAATGGRVARGVLLEGMVLDDTLIDPRVFGFTLGAALLCVLLAGLAPVVQGLGTAVSEGLKTTASQGTGGRGVFRHSLLAVQAALSVVLLIGAGLFVRSLENVVGRDVGVDLDRAVLVSMNLKDAGFTESQVEDTYRIAEERLRRIPGMLDVAVIRQGVPTMTGHGMRVLPAGMDSAPRLAGGGPYYAVVPSNYFATIGTRIQRGRAFTAQEDRAPSRVMIVNRVIADAFWPGQNPIGQCARLGSDSVCTEIVGVVDNAMLFRLVRDDRGLLYIPPSHPAFGKRPPAAIVLRPGGDPRAVLETARAQVQSISPSMPIVTVQRFLERVSWQLRPWRLGATMFTLFGAIAVIIAAIGLYSVMAYAVSQRTREIGVRMALGAQSWDVVRLVTWQSSRPVLIGLAAGIVAAVVASRWVAPMLYETSPRDPATYGLAVVVLAVAALLAAIGPSRRTAKVDPVVSMRAD